MSDFSPIYGVSSTTGKQDAVKTDGSGNLNIAGSITATNPSVSATGAAVPADATYLGGINGGNLIGLATDVNGNLRINPAAGSSLAINDNTTQTQHWAIGATGAGSQNVTQVNGTAISASNPLFEQPVAGTTGGSTPNHAMSAASTNATSLKASAGQVYGLTLSNAAASARYFKIYNKATAPTVGTDTPISTIQIPANGTAIRVYPVGLALGTGIAYACTTGIADTDTGATGANEVSMDVDYK